MVVDHSSIMDVIAAKELSNIPDQTADSILESFIAGCKKFDIYELAAKYGNLLSAIDLEEISIQTNIDIPDNSPPAPGNDGDDDSTDIGDNTEANLNEGGEGSGIYNAPPVTQHNFEFKMATGGQINTKKVLSKLISEENYFKHLEENEEFVYNSLKRQLKYFHPAFHAMTPEGLNNRLTFLLQCTRPGRTIPTETEDGVSSVDADNTAFGAPPICVLRIGDFYHTKIAIDSVSFSYEPLIFDLNPEGIGVQPMIANVSMNFKYIGGQGLEKPVSDLQNALSNNFFANTEVYNENAVATEKTTDISETEAGQGAILDALTQRNTQLVQEMNSNLADLQGNSAGGQGTN